jgi:hypothetical protein
MANLTITAASVLASATALTGEGVAGAAITQGQPLYKDATDSKRLKLADANAAASAEVVGISLNAGSTGQPVKYAYDDALFTPGGTLVVGETYALSATAGALCPIADLTTGDRPVVCFVAISTTQAVLRITRGTAAKP